jgi:hypothetical protein
VVDVELVDVELVDVELVDVDVELLDVVVGDPPVPLGWQLAVWLVGLTTQVYPATQVVVVQSPGWQMPSEPQVSFAGQSCGTKHPLLNPPLPLPDPSLHPMGQPARMPANTPTKPSTESRFIPSPVSTRPTPAAPEAWADQHDAE